MVTFQEDSVAGGWDEAVQYGMAHAADAGVCVDLEYAKKSLLELEKIGMLRVYTMRLDSALIGYCVWLLSPTLLENKMAAQALAVYVRPESRGVLSVKFIEWSVEQLKLHGVQACYTAVGKVDYSRLLTRMGFSKGQTMYRKEL